MHFFPAQPDERFPFRGRTDADITMNPVKVMGAGQHAGFDLKQERHFGSRVVVREGTVLQDRLELQHDRIGFLELSEEAKVGIFTEHGFAVIVREFFLELGDGPVRSCIKCLGGPCFPG